MRPSGTHLYKRVCPSVRRPVRYACAKTALLSCFWPRWDPTLKQMINQHVLRVFSPVCSSICLSHTYVTWSIHAETQPGRIVARSGLLNFHLFIYNWSLHQIQVRAWTLSHRWTCLWTQMRPFKLHFKSDFERRCEKMYASLTEKKLSPRTYEKEIIWDRVEWRR